MDTGIVIRFLRADQRAVQLLAYLAGRGRLTTSVIVALEVVRGSRSPQDEAVATAVLGALDIIDVTYHLALEAGRIARDWSGILGTDKATPDAIIAASAIAMSGQLVTLNTRQFARLNVPGLRLLLIDQQSRDWAAQVS